MHLPYSGVKMKESKIFEKTWNEGFEEKMMYDVIGLSDLDESL